MTNEGVSAWKEALGVLERQWKLPALKWSPVLALAARDLCNDHGPLGKIGHEGSDGSQSWDRV